MFGVCTDLEVLDRFLVLLDHVTLGEVVAVVALCGVGVVLLKQRVEILAVVQLSLNRNSLLSCILKVVALQQIAVLVAVRNQDGLGVIIGVVEFLGDVALLKVIVDDVALKRHNLTVLLKQLFGVTHIVQVGCPRVILALDGVCNPALERAALCTDVFHIGFSGFLQLLLVVRAQGYTQISRHLLDAAQGQYLIGCGFLHAVEHLLISEEGCIHAEIVLIVRNVIDQISRQLACRDIFAVYRHDSRAVTCLIASAAADQHGQTHDGGK